MADKRKKQGLSLTQQALLVSLSTLTAIAFALLIFIAPQMAALLGAVIAGAVALVVERRRHQSRYQTINRKFQTLNEKQDKVERDVIRNARDISSVKMGLRAASRSLEKQGRRLDNLAPGAGKSYQNLAQSMEKVAHAPRSSASSAADQNPKPRPVMPRPEERWTLEPRTSPVEKFSANVLRALLKDSLGRQRIEMFRQPFFYLPGNERRGYEVFGRLKARPGVYVAANDYAGIARQNNMTVRLDKLLAKDVVQALHSGKYPEDIFFLNIDAGHLKDADYMGILLELARQSREKARQICLDIDHRAYETLSQTTRQILSGLARVGFGLCLDQAKPFKIDPDELLKARFRTVKISAPALRLCHADERKFKLFMRIKRRLDANGIRVIATCAEQEADLSIIRQFGINWAQGYALAHPAHVNFNVAAATGKAA